MKVICNYYFFKNSRGFTLLELMVAISIFAIISLLTMGGLSNILNTQEHTEKIMHRLSRQQMIFNIMSRELQQLAARPIRGEYGAVIDAISNETSDGLTGIEYTHQGRYTQGDTVSLQRVSYYLEDKQLVKKVWPILDRVEDSKPVKQVLLDNIDKLSFSFYSSDNKTASDNDINWDSAPDNKPGSKLRAVRVTIKTADYGETYRVFEVVQ